MGRLDPEAIARVCDEVTPDPRTADELHDLLLTLVVTPARQAWRPLFDELAGRGRAQRQVAEGVERWWATECSPQAGVLLYGEADAGHSPEQVAAAVLRGHLDISGPLSAGDLVGRCALSPSTVAVGLAVLENDGFALQGAFTDPDAGGVEWCARRLLARIHSYSRTRRRQAVEPVTAQDFIRFLLRWQHVAPGTQLRGRQGVRLVIEQLQGFEAAVAAWEPQILRRRVTEYQPGFLDRLCHEGELAWLRLSAWQPSSDRRSSPSKATPVTLAFRDDLTWLLQLARLASQPEAPAVGATAEVVEALRLRGARFSSELARDTGRLPTDIEEALWDGVARGLVTADGFAAIRSLVEDRRPPDRRISSVSRLRRGSPRPTRAAGRWSLVGDVDPVEDREGLAEAIADQLLQRWGVVFRDLAAHEGLPVPWRDLQWALRRFEDRGLIRGGRFVTGFSGEQYALPAAMEGLKAIRRLPRNGERVVVNACDPLNLTGVVIRGPRTPAVRTNTVTYVDGLPEDQGDGDNRPTRGRPGDTSSHAETAGRDGSSGTNS
jgi:ATP-dependent Lhr-like helicase